MWAKRMEKFHSMLLAGTGIVAPLAEASGEVGIHIRSGTGKAAIQPGACLGGPGAISARIRGFTHHGSENLAEGLKTSA